MPPKPRASSSSSDTSMSEPSRETKRLAWKYKDINLAPSQWAMNVTNLALHTDLTGLATAKPLKILTSDVLKHIAARPPLIWELREVLERVVNGAVCPEILLVLGEWHKGKSSDDLFRGQLSTHLAEEKMILQYLQAQALRQAFPPNSKRRTDIIYKIMRKMCEQHDGISPFDIKDFQVHDLYKPRLVDNKPIDRMPDFTFISRLEGTHHKMMVDLYKKVTKSRLPFNHIHNKILSFSPICGGVVVREGDGDMVEAEAALHINAWHAATVLHTKRLCRYVRLDNKQNPAPASIGLKIVNDTWTISVGYSMLVDDEEKLCIEDISKVEVGLGNVAGIYMALHTMNALIEYFKLFYLPWLTNFVIPAAITTFSNYSASLVLRIDLANLDEQWSVMKIRSYGGETSTEQKDSQTNSPQSFALGRSRRGAVQGDINAGAEDGHGLMLASDYDVLGCGSGFASILQSPQSW